MVSNYLKRVLREMREPLIPKDLNEYFIRIGDDEEVSTISESIEDEEQIELLKIKFLLNQLPALNFETLKYLMRFLFTVVEYEPANRMTAYNIAVTVGPNLFRVRAESTQDMNNCGIYYEALIRMIEQHRVLFDKSIDYEHLIESLQHYGVCSSNKSTPAKKLQQKETVVI